MKTRTRSRLIVGGLLALALATFSGIKTNSQSATASAQSATAARAATRLVAHEWGTFTSVAGKDGVSLEWRPLAGPSDLPKFVHTIQSDGLRRGVSKGSISGSIRMETPVIYFYADRETEVSVKVDFPKGKITEWYPHARSAGASIDWGKFKVLPGASFNFPKESALSHYYPARETDAAPVQVCGINGKENEQEKFLFYRGVGSFDLPLSVKLEADQVVLKNLAQPEISNLIIFENRGGKIGYRLCDAFTGEMTHERPALTQNMDALLADLERILMAEGLYQKEARSMIQTWRDSWFEEGLRVFYVLPRSTTDAILPLTMEPQPTELTRVLIGRAEVITPEMEREVQGQISKLNSSSAAERDAAMREIRKYGRFSEVILKNLLAKEMDLKARATIQQLLKTSDAATD